MGILKILVLGEAAVGKTTLINSYSNKKGIESIAYKYTIGVGFPKSELVQVRCGTELKSARIQMWDIAGQSHFSVIRTEFYRGARGVIFMFDLIRPPTLQALEDTWIDECYANAGKMGDYKKIPSLLVGGKSDLIAENLRTYVKKKTVEEFARKKGMPYIETSAKNYMNIKEAVIKLVQLILGCE
ncbi:MAG: GTP-binding protein [Candidatus Hodarchaeota archaeon]